MFYKEYLDKLNKWADVVEKEAQKKLPKITFSVANKKMGKIHSISNPPILTCVSCGCNQNLRGEIECYACYGQTGMECTQLTYARNYWLYKNRPELYWNLVKNEVMFQMYFRFNVSGDIVDYEYLEGIVDVARSCKKSSILVFTKKYDLVNKWIRRNGELPSNLQIVFSVWQGLECKNPHNLPTSHLVYYDGTTTAREDAFKCPDDCSHCNCVGVGCWALQKGQQVVFKQHGGKHKHN